MSISIRHVLPEETAAVYRLIPEFAGLHDAHAIRQRIGDRAACALVAYDEAQPVGFKLGYETAPGEFYSWLGGVVSAYRRDGVAQRLLETQERWAQENGYRRLRVKTRNRFRAMLMLLIRNGYQIIELEKKGEAADYRLLLEKSLTGA
ncbi:GNAT family N-acetyltransferase [Cronobacter muytjensii]|uniref:GNAT family N-acetyltransferase n=1 Tax=Cronobacter muytjensii TaxID=413501 RepID=UPI0003A6B6EC|nr:GNAT family N-acetyltransferase [Cronobacter muytjensii]ALB70000.1 acetyltransferase [Cronobacter muytjensii ATCC 51329]ELY6276739.1 GNAT family N-acetyltransferase [Cronobacter muytjensii]MEB8640878.1 GNAT family N-acetyltransferase [Cronobacter muytjensii]